MNILMITQMYPQPDDVGDNSITPVVRYFAREWVKMGHRVLVAHGASRFPLPLYLIPPGIKNRVAGATSKIFPSLPSRKTLRREEFGITVRRFPMFKLYPGFPYSPRAMAAYAEEIARWLAEEEFVPDLVAGHFSNPSAELTALLSKRYGAKSSIVFHLDCSEEQIKKYRIRESVAQIKAIGVRSAIEARDVQKRLGLSEPPFICYSGVPEDAVRSARAVCDKMDFSNGVRYLYVGSFIRRKYLDVVIRAFLRTAGEKDSLTVIGGGPEDENLRKLAAELDKNGRIRFLGKVPRERVMEEMGRAHIFTLVSTFETFGLVYIEAMLQGCLTIASRGEGFDGLIRDGENGFLCAAGDQQELESVYKRIGAMTTEERNAVGQAAIEVAKHFSEREVAERYLQDILDRQ